MRTPTTDAAPTLRRGRRTRRAVGTAVAAPLLLAGLAACAGESEDGGGVIEADGTGSGEFEATAAFLRQAAEQSTAEGYRLEMRLSMGGEVDETAAPLMSGEVDGDRYHYLMDLGVMMKELADGMGQPMPPELGDLDLTMEMAGDLQTMYMRAPMFAQFSDLGGVTGGDQVGALSALGDGWGYADLTALGDQLPGDLADAVTQQGADPQAVIDMVRNADNVEDLGTGEVQGTPVHGLSTRVTMAEIIEASGQDPEAMAEAGAIGEAEDVTAALYDTETFMEVWVDDDGYLRRMEFGFDLAHIAEAMGDDPDELTAAGLGEFSYTMDMFDYGTAVDFAPPTDAVDITDEFTALVQG